VFIPEGTEHAPATAWIVDAEGTMRSSDEPWAPGFAGARNRDERRPARAPAPADVDVDVERYRGDVGVLREPPIPLPRFMGIEPIGNLAGVNHELNLQLRAHDDAWYFRCQDDEGLALVRVDAAGDAHVVAARPIASLGERWRARLAMWGRGFWGPRLGMDRSTWDAQRAPPVPPGGEALATVGACHFVYASTVERVGDVDGSLARFYVQHVQAALRGSAFLVVRDRTMGLVTVLDAKRRIVARSDELLADTPVSVPARGR
jgi:hypothetical protein